MVAFAAFGTCLICVYVHMSHGTVQEGQVALPSISQEATETLNRMGLSFSCSNELFIGLVRHWKLFLQHHRNQTDAAAPDQDLPQEAISMVSHSLAVTQATQPVSTE